ncbi:hypothetical protein ACFE04_012883 [Oxalis oulophora]
MGSTAREKHIRANRRSSSSRSIKPDSDPSKPISDSVQDSSPTNQNPSFPIGFVNYNFSSAESQLEEMLMKNLESLYNHALKTIVDLGYGKDAALKAILNRGFCFGDKDIVTNVVKNSLAYLNGTSVGGGSDVVNPNVGEETTTTKLEFADLKDLLEYSLSGMVYLVKQVRPYLSKGYAMWCLLECDLNVTLASTMELPSPPDGHNFEGMDSCSGTMELPLVFPDGRNVVENTMDSNGNSGGVIAPALCRFHSGWGFANDGNPEFSANGGFSYCSDLSLQRDIEFPKRFDLSPSMKSSLRRNVAMFAAGYRASTKQTQTQPQGKVSSENSKDSQNSKSQEWMSSIMSRLRDLNIDENMESGGEDQKDEMIVSLLNQTKDLTRRVKERREWAHQKALQAAKKLSSDMAELKTLRIEKEQNLWLKTTGQPTLESSTVNRLTDVENDLRKASGKVDKANEAVRRLENENAEIRAEMEASKLSASESLSASLQVAKREKKSLKKLKTAEKQRAKLQEEIADEKEKIKELQRSLAQVQQAGKQFEIKWKDQVKAREEAIAEVGKERRAKEEAEANSKRKLEGHRLKIEIDFQRHKDDLQRLEEELSRLQASAETPELNNNQSNNLSAADRTRAQENIIARLISELEESPEKEVSLNRECIICREEEASIVYLPCAHLVLCAGCNESYFQGKKGRVTCPCCRVLIEQQIRVFGASS